MVFTNGCGLTLYLGHVLAYSMDYGCKIRGCIVTVTHVYSRLAMMNRGCDSVSDVTLHLVEWEKSILEKEKKFGENTWKRKLQRGWNWRKK